MNKIEREERLKQYYFKCGCSPCKEDWPTYENVLSFNASINKNYFVIINKIFT